MHKFPANEEQRKTWIKFVRKHRPNFTPTNSSVICSTHFDKSCFGTRHNIDVPDELKPRARYLLEGSVPTKDSVVLEEMPATSCAKRKVSHVLNNNALLFYRLLEKKLLQKVLLGYSQSKLSWSIIVESCRFYGISYRRRQASLMTWTNYLIPKQLKPCLCPNVLAAIRVMN